MNIKEIAKMAGVSPSTVSKIVNKKDDSIGSETRERVLKVVKEYNYTPYAFAASTVKKTWLIGILLRSSASFDPVFQGMLLKAQEKGYTVMVCDSALSREQELKNITALCKHKVDGILWEPVGKDSCEFARHIGDMQIPCIILGPGSGGISGETPLRDGNPRETSFRDGTPHETSFRDGKPREAPPGDGVSCDGGFGSDAFGLPYEALGYELTRELIKRKHKNIACLLSEGRRTAAFLSGYRQCLFDHHITMEQSLVFHGWNDELIYQINTRRVSAIVSSHYESSLSFCRMMQSLHYKIPEDFSLVTLKEKISFQPDAASEISAYLIDGGQFGSQLCQTLITRIEKCGEVKAVWTQKPVLDSEITVGVPFHLQAERITVVGSINIDTYLNVPQLPGTGKTVTTATSSVYPGGKGINQSIGAAKLGRPVALIGNVGSDLDADRIYRALHECGVDDSGVKRCSQVNTGRAYIFVEAGGNSMISILTGANDTLSPEDIREQEQLFEQTGYCLIQSEIPIETVLEACRIAHRHQAKTIFKPSACSSLSDELLRQVDILIPNEDELKELCPGGGSLPEQVAGLLERGAETVIVTLGERGCYVRTGEWEEYVPAASFSAVDKTGASDAFISALAAYLQYGYHLKEAVRIATYAAGFCVAREGVVPALIDKNSLEAYIQQKDAGLISCPQSAPLYRP